MQKAVSGVLKTTSENPCSRAAFGPLSSHFERKQNSAKIILNDPPAA
jgi:hypothetical protein